MALKKVRARRNALSSVVNGVSGQLREAGRNAKLLPGEIGAALAAGANRRHLNKKADAQYAEYQRKRSTLSPNGPKSGKTKRGLAIPKTVPWMQRNIDAINGKFDEPTATPKPKRVVKKRY